MSDNGTADLIFVNGAVATLDAARRWVQAVAVRDGKIVLVGSDSDVADHRGDRTEVVDLRGRMLLPGFQDAHVHPVAAGLNQLRCTISDLRTADAYVAAIEAYADSHPDTPWILGGRWAMDAFPNGAPSKQLLDDVVHDRPVCLWSLDGHDAWVNSVALQLAGITRDTADPNDGRIERDAFGEPQGTLHEGACDLVSDLTPDPTDDELLESLLVAQRTMFAWGVTAWQDAYVDVTGDWRNLDAYLQAGSDGRLKARVVGALWWDRARGLEQIDDLIERRARGPAGRFAPTSVKIMQDGILENLTGAVLDPYLDAEGHATGDRGISFVEPEVLNEAVVRLDALGFQIHFHTIGERAVRDALNAAEAARRANGWTDGRHHLAHIQVIHPDDLPRFRRLGAVANAQPLWAAHEAQMDALTIPFLGEPRWTWQYPFASLLRHGAMLAMGSDWPVSTADPLEEMHVAVNRKLPAHYPSTVAEVFLPEERIDLGAALAGFTVGSAYVNHLDEVTGSIEVGKFGDVCVLDRNIFEQPVDEIASARVHLTYLEGERVYTSDDA